MRNCSLLKLKRLVGNPPSVSLLTLYCFVNDSFMGRLRDGKNRLNPRSMSILSYDIKNKQKKTHTVTAHFTQTLDK